MQKEKEGIPRLPDEQKGWGSPETDRIGVAS